MRKLLPLFAFMLSFGSTQVLAWWNDAWSYRVPVAIDTSPSGANISTTSTNVSVLIRLHSANFEDFFLVNEDLSDLRFVGSDDKTPLKFHVESFDLINQLAFIWVQIPQITGNLSSEKIWMYYGNDQAVAGQDSGGTFDVNQTAVFHFSEPAGLPIDATAYQNSISALDGLLSPTSLIAGGLSLAGTGGVTIADSPSSRLLADKGWTLSAWIKPTGVQEDAILVFKDDGTNNLEVAIDQSALYAKAKLGGNAVETPRTVPLTLDSWQHIAVALGNNKLSIFLNGLEVASVDVAMAELGGDTVLGSLPDKTRGFIGEIDELRLSNIAKGSDSLLIAAKSQGMTSNLAIAGKGEQLGNAGGTSYFVTIFQNTGTEGWVVIVLLTIMAVLSWIVILFKALFLGRVRKDNKKFMGEYAKSTNNNLASLDKEDEEESGSDADILFGDDGYFKASPLYHIYHKGIKEVRDRLGNLDDHKHQNGLSDSSINSIRSGLDAYVVREIQGLNRNMVLLTIAVSGGPFLGLLGTVLGVMITFAAIAASGDVNIAAIAPGVAAALLTTVAGLVVAIPALFGYNWLATRIKSMVAEMHVFTDEYVTKLAEQYGKQ